MTQREISEWLHDWLKLFPPDVESGGHAIRSEHKDCVKKMLAFCKTHPDYTKECIFAATRMYLLEQYSKNWAYTKLATYFISKLGQPSMLESYCKKVAAGRQANITEAPPEYDPMSDFI